MTRRLVAAAVALCLTLPVYADFGAVARAIDAQRGVSRVWIPFLGVARAAVWLVRPQGVKDFQLAVFRGAENIDARRLQRIMTSSAGKGFAPLVQAWSRRSGEWSFIYARPDDDARRVELMILAHDDEETVLVRVNVDPSVIGKQIRLEPRRVRHVAEH